MEKKHNLQWKVAAQWILIVQEVVSVRERTRVSGALKSPEEGIVGSSFLFRRLTRGKGRRGIGGSRFFGRHILGRRGSGIG
jgi:hypothetical protein